MRPPVLVRAALVGCCFVLATATSTGQQASPPASSGQQVQPVFRSEAGLVLVDAYPQRDGRIVEGLTATDFEVYEDGKPQTITNLEFVRIEGNVPETARRDPNSLTEMAVMAADPHNRVFVAYLDMLQTTVEGSQRIRVPLVQTLNRLTGPADLFGVMTPDMRPRDLTLAQRMLSTEDQLARYWAWGARGQIVPANVSEVAISACFKERFEPGQGFVPWIVESDGRTLDRILIERRREDQTLSGLAGLVSHLGSMREARSVLLLVSDGFLGHGPHPSLRNELARDQRSKTPPMPGRRLEDADFSACAAELDRLALLDNERRLQDVITAAQRANVSFYPVAPNGLVVFDAGAAAEPLQGRMSPAQNSTNVRNRVLSLTTLAENTNGIATVNRNDVAAGLQTVVDDLSAYYLLGYHSTDDRVDTRFRRIEVKLKQPGVTVRARRGYVARSSVATSSALTGGSTPSLAPGIADAIATLGKVRPQADLFIRGATSGSELRVVVELASRYSETSAWRAGGAVTVDVRSATGERVTMAKGTIEAGARAAVVVVPVSSPGPFVLRATIAGGDRLLDGDPFTVTAASGLLGTPLAFRAAASPRAPLKPMADLALRRTERVHIEWPLAPAIDQRSVRLLSRLGQPLTADIGLTERIVEGQPQIAVDLGLAALAEGDYVIEVQVASGATAERRWLAFRVVR